MFDNIIKRFLYRATSVFSENDPDERKQDVHDYQRHTIHAQPDQSSANTPTEDPQRFIPPHTLTLSSNDSNSPDQLGRQTASPTGLSDDFSFALSSVENDSGTKIDENDENQMNDYEAEQWERDYEDFYRFTPENSMYDAPLHDDNGTLPMTATSTPEPNWSPNQRRSLSRTTPSEQGIPISRRESGEDMDGFCISMHPANFIVQQSQIYGSLANQSRKIRDDVAEFKDWFAVIETPTVIFAHPKYKKPLLDLVCRYHQVVYPNANPRLFTQGSPRMDVKTILDFLIGDFPFIDDVIWSALTFCQELGCNTIRVRGYGMKWQMSIENPFIHADPNHPSAGTNKFDIARTFCYGDQIPLVKYIKKPSGARNFEVFNELGKGFGTVTGTIYPDPKALPELRFVYKIYSTYYHVLKV